MDNLQTVTIYFRESALQNKNVNSEYKVRIAVESIKITDVTKIVDDGKIIEITATQPTLTTIPWDVILFLREENQA